MAYWVLFGCVVSIGVLYARCVGAIRTGGANYLWFLPLRRDAPNGKWAFMFRIAVLVLALSIYGILAAAAGARLQPLAEAAKSASQPVERDPKTLQTQLGEWARYMGALLVLSYLAWEVGLAGFREKSQGTLLSSWHVLFWWIPRGARFTAMDAILGAVSIAGACAFLISSVTLIYALGRDAFLLHVLPDECNPNAFLLRFLLGVFGISTFLLSEGIRVHQIRTNVRNLGQMNAECADFLRLTLKEGRKSSNRQDKEEIHRKSLVRMDVIQEVRRPTSRRSFCLVDWLPTVGFFSSEQTANEMISYICRFLFSPQELDLDTSEFRPLDKAPAGILASMLLYYPFVNRVRIICWDAKSRDQFLRDAQYRFPPPLRERHQAVLEALIGRDDEYDGGLIEQHGNGELWFTDRIGRQHFALTTDWVLAYAVDPTDAKNEVQGQISRNPQLTQFYGGIFEDYLREAVSPRHFNWGDSFLEMYMHRQPNTQAIHARCASDDALRDPRRSGRPMSLHGNAMPYLFIPQGTDGSKTDQSTFSFSGIPRVSGNASQDAPGSRHDWTRAMVTFDHLRDLLGRDFPQTCEGFYVQTAVRKASPFRVITIESCQQHGMKAVVINEGMDDPLSGHRVLREKSAYTLLLGTESGVHQDEEGPGRKRFDDVDEEMSISPFCDPVWVSAPDEWKSFVTNHADEYDGTTNRDQRNVIS